MFIFVIPAIKINKRIKENETEDVFILSEHYPGLGDKSYDFYVEGDDLYLFFDSDRLLVLDLVHRENVPDRALNIRENNLVLVTKFMTKQSIGFLIRACTGKRELGRPDL